ncbi:MAG: hypothetical protein HOO19_06200 [Rhodospirillaceae bacterium]|jgi:hypothetical protein|nr:hypothetical protein [Rhodospirillaceae bacterium]MBT3883541.1 hypothetical protein [Rhodospirillaceae bacterium]MBT4118093.1 hypothetical protein [Rhodospirillaceae bacterium]MBT4674273.1 hypothetical protein [Rhodospirillaceae bacterium]MBT4721860.1 hypothetical protein [Rhodospirillaceae bacterium]
MILRRILLAAPLLGLFWLPPASHAGEVDVVGAKARLVRSSNGVAVWRFDVTLRHADAGWKHYADNWEILKMDGTLLGRRVLLHPHDNEQPFTRSLSGVKIPTATKKVRVRGHDKQHGYGGKELLIALPKN